MYKKLHYRYQQNNDGLIFNIELAGKSKEDVKVHKEDYAIVINIGDSKYYIGYEDFIYAPKYDFDTPKAKMKNGLLTITVPFIKKEQKQIEIE